MARVGGDGEAPGGFRSVDFVATVAGDSVLAFDRSLQRIFLRGEAEYLPLASVGGSESALVQGEGGELRPAAVPFLGSRSGGPGVRRAVRSHGDDSPHVLVLFAGRVL